MARKRIDNDEKYVLDIIAEIMDENYEWQKTFDTLRGDPGITGQMRKLPIDAYSPRANLIIEYREKQHFKPVEIMDRRMMISGVHRGEQRKLYDQRKEKWAEDNDFKFCVVTYVELAHKNNGHLKRDESHDKKVLKSRLFMD